MRNFIIISQMVYNLQCGHEYMVEMSMFNVQRAITPKVGKTEFSSCLLHVISWCFTFVRNHNNISNGLTEWTGVHNRNGYVQCARGNISKSRQIRITVMSSACGLSALHLCEVS